jgi:hypothetical protein
MNTYGVVASIGILTCGVIVITIGKKTSHYIGFSPHLQEYEVMQEMVDNLFKHLTVCVVLERHSTWVNQIWESDVVHSGNLAWGAIGRHT